ncbi:hypothetical protein D3C84_1063680 [compost metagenome]
MCVGRRYLNNAQIDQDFVQHMANESCIADRECTIAPLTLCLAQGWLHEQTGDASAGGESIDIQLVDPGDVAGQDLQVTAVFPVAKQAGDELGRGAT